MAEAASSPSDTSGRAVIFDIDGTLCNSWNLGFSATQQVLTARGYPRVITAEEYHEFCVYVTPERLARHARIEPVGSAEFTAAGIELGAAFDSLYIGLVDSSTAGFYPGITDLLAQLHAGGPGDGGNVQLGALTNAAVAYAEAVLTANGVRHLFGTVHGADSVPAAKPKPDGLLLCCAELGLPPSRCIYVGDAPTDGRAALATWADQKAGVGVVGVGVSYGSHGAASLAPHFATVVGSVEVLGAALADALRAPA